MLLPNSITPMVLFLLPMLASTMSEVKFQLTAALADKRQQTGLSAHQELLNSGKYFHRGSGRCEAIQCI